MSNFGEEIPDAIPSEFDMDKDKTFVPATAEELADFVGEFGGERKQRLRDDISILIGRQHLDTRYPDMSLQDPDMYLREVARAALNESRNFDELLAKGTILNGMKVSSSAFTTYHLARLELAEEAHRHINGDGQ